MTLSGFMLSGEVVSCIGPVKKVRQSKRILTKNDAKVEYAWENQSNVWEVLIADLDDSGLMLVSY